MDDPVDRLLIDVRANTQGFAADVAAMRSTFDATVVDGFARAGDVLERGLLGAIRKGSLGFDDLKRVALTALEQIAAQALASFAGGGQGDPSAGLGALIGSLFGLPGRATGGPVAPQRPYLVGERGPELFVPASAGSVAPLTAAPRDVRVAITIAAPPGMAAPQALERSSRQVASAVRRALSEY